MRDEVIEILEMICPDIDVNDEDMNLPEDLDSMDIIALIADITEAKNLITSFRQYSLKANLK